MYLTAVDLREEGTVPTQTPTGWRPGGETWGHWVPFPAQSTRSQDLGANLSHSGEHVTNLGLAPSLWP